MSEHTKECWEHGGTAVESKDDLVRIFGESIDTHVGELGQYFMEIFTEEGARIAFLAGPTSHANARRIVACVNACADYSTDALENMHFPIRKEYELIRQQRDELLAALKAAKATLEREDDGLSPICDTIWHGPAETLFDFIDEAIAKATA